MYLYAWGCGMLNASVSVCLGMWCASQLHEYLELDETGDGVQIGTCSMRISERLPLDTA